MIYAIPLFCFIVPFVAAIYALKHHRGRTVLVAAGVTGALMIWAIVQGQRAQGWDGLGYAIAAFLMAAPAVLGMSAGALLGLLRRRRAASE